MAEESGVILTRLRELKKKTQQEVADDLDTVQTLISAHERGAKPIGRKWLERYADYYGVSTDVIAGRRVEALPAIYPPGPLAHVYVYGTVRAGEPMLACEDIRDYETVDKKTYQDGDFYLEVEGDSMEPDFIPAGARVLVRPGLDFTPNDIVVVNVDGDNATLARLRYVDKKAIITKSNPRYPSQEYPANKVRVVGKVVEWKIKPGLLKGG